MESIWAEYGSVVTAIVVLILADLLSGVLAALKAKAFEWERLGDFYGTKVVPYLGGYLIIALVSQSVDGSMLGDFSFLVGPAAEEAAKVLVFATLSGSIIGNLQAIGIIPVKLQPTLGRLGLFATPKAKGS